MGKGVTLAALRLCPPSFIAREVLLNEIADDAPLAVFVERECD